MPPLNPFNKTCVALAVSQLLALPVQAATITVNSNQDDGTDCTLREAVVSMNTASLQTGCVNTGAAFGTDDTINFALAGSQTITLTGGQLSITFGKNVTINGSDETNLTIDGGGANRVLYLEGNYSDGGSTVSLNNLTLTGGSATRGGGIYSKYSSVSLNTCTVSGNSASSFGGGIRLGAFSSLSLTNSTVSGNSAGTRGGGIYASYSGVTLSNSTVSGNSATNKTGGIQAFGSNVSLNNSTVSGNSTKYGAAQGYRYGSAEIGGYEGTFTADNNNLFGDSSHTNAEAFLNFTPGVNDITATSDGTNPTALSSILEPLADNGGPTQTHALPPGSPAIDAGDGTICTSAPVNSQDQRGVVRSSVCDIGAFELEQTVTITVNSADDTSGGNAAECTLREAIESSNLNTAVDGCAAGENSEQIVFDTGVAATITLSSALPSIYSNLSITGPAQGLTIDAAGTGRVLTIDGATVGLTNLTLTGGLTVNRGGGIYATRSGVSLNNSTVSGNSAIDDGGGIYATRSGVSLNNSTVSGNSAVDDGGGIYAYTSSVGLVNSTVSGNFATNRAGGIHAYTSSVGLANSTVSGSSAGTYGGGIFSSNSSVSLSSSTVSGNSAAFEGGGIIAVNSSSVSLTNSLVAGNVSPVGAEIKNFNNTSTFTSHKNLFGESSHADDVAFDSFTPGGSDITATSNGTKPTALSSIFSPLADNGGPTKTHALVKGSPAIGTGNNAICAASPINNLDQRGERRDAKCDIGSYEDFIDDSGVFVVPLKNGKVVIFSL